MSHEIRQLIITRLIVYLQREIERVRARQRGQISSKNRRLVMTRKAIGVADFSG